MDKSQEIHVGHIIFSSKWEWIAQRNKRIAKPHCLSSFLAPPPFFSSPPRLEAWCSPDRLTEIRVAPCTEQWLHSTVQTTSKLTLEHARKWSGPETQPECGPT